MHVSLGIRESEKAQPPAETTGLQKRDSTEVIGCTYLFLTI